MSIKFLSFDVDGTLLENEDSDDFYKKWNSLKFEDKPLLCYNSGRLLTDMRDLIKTKILPEPDYIISGVGTTIFDFKEQKRIKEFSEVLEEGWDRDKVTEVIKNLNFQIEKQPDHFQNNFKSSWFFDDATNDDIQKIKKTLALAGLKVNVIYSSNRHLDILPEWANKGNALDWLLKHLDISPENALVAGDSGNDSAMFKINGINGIIVGNSQNELYQETKHLNTVYFSEKRGKDAVLEGMKQYNINFELSENGLFQDEEDKEEKKEKEDTLKLLEIEEISGIQKEHVELIREGYRQAIKVIRKNITPIGFSACSLEDNESIGTDTNYRSVWARDGSIVVTGTTSLIKDKAIYDCQRNTLETLINNISPNGQIPSNIFIDDGRPDYSGVGGICSIDSGLWLVIAFHDFVRATKDLDFLRKHLHSLSQVMSWLSAQDGNNDALLEIPEAGDWTDLFGRSYNVLYDEVLWYRANICFGRLHEMLGNNEKTGDYLRWSQIIKREILLNFWPTTQNKLYHSINFAEQQYALGDARYLLAQVTPFDYSWRCDVYGNVLAYLYDVVDSAKAQQTFRFLWGVGINEPYPVENVYPAVNAGDPDWRPYYTVNLLNLPHHYHNGGIWPFVGGCWVRFLNKLGLRDLALQELYKLTLLNKSGAYNEWEFNEWSHAKTGRPMGKAFQAWSASEFIAACHDLDIINK